ncbi:LysR substrate-binding domain-containing protein [Thioclava sp. GXIMD2076]|uniref:LysR family transcriptional regulator n=1 Tax=Thioclava sp. GXIMD2076 TaxID=3131931 RepID=UPI0030D406C4
MLEPRQLRYFVTLAEELHYGRAADKLNIVQPALSMQIKALEEDLGHALFDRSGRPIALTQAGQALLPEARAILSQCETAREVVRRAGDGLTGTIRLGVSASAIISGLMARAILHHRKAWPGVQVKPVELHPAGQVVALAEGQVEACLGPATLGLGQDRAFQSDLLVSFPYQVALAADHPLADRPAIGTEDLRMETFIGLSGAEDQGGMEATRAALAFEPYHGMKAASPLSMLALVEAGLGIAIVSGALRPIIGAGLRLLPLSDARHRMDVSFIRRASRTDPLLEAFAASARHAADEIGQSLF